MTEEQIEALRESVRLLHEEFLHEDSIVLYGQTLRINSYHVIVNSSPYYRHSFKLSNDSIINIDIPRTK